MTPRRFTFEPWKRGPAEIIRFPVVPCRAIHVRAAPDGKGFVGVFAGATPEDCWSTECGSKAMVMEAVSQRHVRRGAPIIVGDA